MNIFSHGRNAGPFFCFLQLRIICRLAIIGRALCSFFFVQNLPSSVRGGVIYWRGRVLAGGVGEQGLAGVDIEQGGGANGGAVREAAALCRLAVGLAGHSERGGNLGGAGVEGGKSGKQGGHGVASVSRARRFVVVSPSWSRFSVPTYLRQRVIDGNGIHAPFSFSASV